MLNNEQQRLLTEFYNQENVVAQLKNNLNIVNSIEPLSIVDTSSSSSHVILQLDEPARQSGSTGSAIS